MSEPRPLDPRPAPQAQAPSPPSPGAEERPGRARLGLGPGRGRPRRRARSLSALTVCARRPGRAAGQAEQQQQQQQERQQAARREARAPGPPGHTTATSHPARPRLLLRPGGAEIRRRAPRGGGRAGRFRRRVGERRAPRGPGGGGGGRRLRVRPSYPHQGCAPGERSFGSLTPTPGGSAPAARLARWGPGDTRQVQPNDTAEYRVPDCARRRCPVL